MVDTVCENCELIVEDLDGYLRVYEQNDTCVKCGEKFTKIES